MEEGKFKTIELFFCFRTFEHSSYGRGKGVWMFSLSTRTLLPSKHKISKEKYQLMSIVDTTVQGLTYQLVLVYASKGCAYWELVVDLKKLLLSNITVIVTGDFNFDRRESNALTCFLGAKMLQQIVKWPTHNKGRTIEHIYVSKNARVQVTRHSPYYSDHDALLIEFEHFPWS